MDIFKITQENDVNNKPVLNIVVSRFTALIGKSFATPFFPFT